MGATLRGPFYLEAIIMKIAFLAGRAHLKKGCLKAVFEHLKTKGEVWDYSPRVVTEHDVADCDLVVDNNSGVNVPEHIPHLMIDLGYTHRHLGTYQVGLRSLNSLAPENVKHDREFYKVETGLVKGKAPILILGQKENDRQHGLSAPELNFIYQDLIDRIKMAYPDNKILFRNHPKSKNKLTFSGIEDRSYGKIEELQGLIGCVVTYNSTGALPFLAKGAPVICHQSAFYSRVCMTYEDIGKDFYSAPKKDRGLLFARIAYSQFTKEELSKPELIDKLVDYALTGQFPEEWTQEELEEVIEPITQQQFELCCDALEENNWPKARKMVKQVFPDEKFKNREVLDTFCNKTILEFKTQGN